MLSSAEHLIPAWLLLLLQVFYGTYLGQEVAIKVLTAGTDNLAQMTREVCPTAALTADPSHCQASPAARALATSALQHASLQRLHAQTCPPAACGRLQQDTGSFTCTDLTTATAWVFPTPHADVRTLGLSPLPAARRHLPTARKLLPAATSRSGLQAGPLSSACCLLPTTCQLLYLDRGCSLSGRSW